MRIGSQVTVSQYKILRETALEFDKYMYHIAYEHEFPFASNATDTKSNLKNSIKVGDWSELIIPASSQQGKNDGTATPKSQEMPSIDTEGLEELEKVSEEIVREYEEKQKAICNGLVSHLTEPRTSFFGTIVELIL